jgi:polyhydroxybutyrate depolymerase
LADRVGAAVAFPQAISPIGSGYEWDLDGDLSFLAAVVEELRVRCSPPAGRVAMTGMSGGARMSCRFADTHAEWVAMVGAVGGLRAPVRRPSRPVPILAFHGTADRINPFNGGGNPRWVESVPDAARVGRGERPARPADDDRHHGQAHPDHLRDERRPR